MQAKEIVMLGKLASAQGYCDAIIKTASETGSVKCAQAALADITEVLEYFRSQSSCSNHYQFGGPHDTAVASTSTSKGGE